MEQLIYLLTRYRYVMLFALLESIGLWILLNKSIYQATEFAQFNHEWSSQLTLYQENWQRYWQLIQENNKLAQENAYLRKLINKKHLIDEKIDTFYHYTATTVIRNSVRFSENFITIDKGKKDGIKKNMGVVSPQGIIGKVNATSDHFSLVTSILHTQMMVSVIHKPSGHLCTVKWDGSDPRFVQVYYLPKHTPVHTGDSIVTSGYDHIFPPDLFVGSISQNTSSSNLPYHQLKMTLVNDFYKLKHAYVVSWDKSSELDSLENNSKQ